MGRPTASTRRTTGASVASATVDSTRREEYRIGRNWLRRGDLVRVAPREGSAPGTHGFPARFLYTAADKGGVFACVIEQVKDEKGRMVSCGFRFIEPSRMQRRDTTKDPLKQAKARQEAKHANRNLSKGPQTNG